MSQGTEDSGAIFFMDVMPQGPGHALIVPKAPSRNMLDADPAVLAKLLPLIQKIAKASKQRSAPMASPSCNSTNQPAARPFFHLHYHVIPRSTGCR